MKKIILLIAILPLAITSTYAQTTWTEFTSALYKPDIEKMEKTIGIVPDPNESVSDRYEAVKDFAMSKLNYSSTSAKTIPIQMILLEEKILGEYTPPASTQLKAAMTTSQIQSLPGVSNNINNTATISKEIPINELEQHVFHLINRDRINYGRTPLIIDKKLSTLARSYAEYMLKNNHFGHIDLEGHSGQYRAQQAGIKCSVDENFRLEPRLTKSDDVAILNNIEKSIITEQTNQHSQRENILMREHSYVGIGIVRSADKLIMVQEFTCLNPFVNNALANSSQKEYSQQNFSNHNLDPNNNPSKISINQEIYPKESTTENINNDGLSPSPIGILDSDSREPKVENDFSAGGRVTPSVLAYVTFVNQLLSGHCHLPKTSTSFLLKTHFRINNDGTITNTILNTTQSDIQVDLSEYNRAFLDAVRAVEIYTKPPQIVLDDLKSDHIDICLTSDPQKDQADTSLPEAISYVKYIQKTIRATWAGAASKVPPQPRRVRVYFKIHKDGSVSDLNVDPSSNIDPRSDHIDIYAETGMAAIRACSPFRSPAENMFEKTKSDYINFSFTFDYRVPNPRRGIPLLLPYRGLFIL